MTAPLEYKGYFGSVDVDVDGGFVFGKLLFIRDVVSYQSSSPAAIRSRFEAAVDDYLETCRELGEVPDTPCKGTFNVRVGSEVHRECMLAAERSGLSLNDWVRRACELKLSQDVAHGHAKGERKGSAIVLEADFEEVRFEGLKSWQPKTHND